KQPLELWVQVESRRHATQPGADFLDRLHGNRGLGGLEPIVPVHAPPAVVAGIDRGHLRLALGLRLRGLEDLFEAVDFLVRVVLRSSSGSVVKAIKLFTTTWGVPPTVYPSSCDMFSVSATMP